MKRIKSLDTSLGMILENHIYKSIIIKVKKMENF